MKGHQMRGGVRAGASLWLLRLLTAAVFAGGVGMAQAAIYYVESPLDSGGTCWENPPNSGVYRCTTLRTAIMAANATFAHDQILFNFAGQTITLTQGGLAVANNGSLHITGQLNTISGNNASRVFKINTGANVTLQGMTITQGRAGFGAGISNEGTLTLTRSTVSNNVATDYYGGGIYNRAFATANISHSTISGNTAPFGGGGIDNEAALDILHSTLFGNSLALQNSNSGSARIRASVLANSTSGADCTRESGIVRSSNNLFEHGGECVTEFLDEYFMIGDPKLGPLDNTLHPYIKTHQPLPGSPLVYAIYCVVNEADQLGTPRPPPICDIGAIQVKQPLFANGFESPQGATSPPVPAWLYVPQFATGTIKVYRDSVGNIGPANYQLVNTASLPTGTRPNAIVFDRNGKLWVVDGNRRLLRFSRASVTTQAFPAAEVTVTPSVGGTGDFFTMAFWGNDAYVTHSDFNGVHAVRRFTLASLNAGGSPAPAQSYTHASFVVPAGLAFDLYGRLWVSHYGSANNGHRLTRLNVSTGTVTRIIESVQYEGRPSLASPEGLAFDLGNQLWVGNNGQPSVSMYGVPRLEGSSNNPSYMRVLSAENYPPHRRTADMWVAWHRTTTTTFG